MPFKVELVTDEEALAEVFKLRYKVYCLEWGFEKPEKYPDRLETDEYDKYSLHFAARDDSQKIVGTVRLILGSSAGFPAERYCQVDFDRSGIPEECFAEISRLAINREYRKRSEDKYIYGPDEERRVIGSFDQPFNFHNKNGHQINKNNYRRADDRFKYNKYASSRAKNETQDERRSKHELITSLYKAIYHESKKRKLTHWYAVMTKGLVILLKKFGFSFQAVGDPVDYHGIRTPYLGEIQRIEQEVQANNPELYDEFTKDLQLF